MSRNKTGLLALLVVFAAIPAGLWAKAPSAPAPSDLLDIAFNNPTQAYRGQMVVSYWVGAESKAEDVKIYFLPPNKYRFEFLAPNGTVDRIVMTDGTREQVQLMKNNQSADTYTTNNPPSLIRSQDEKTLLASNYKTTVKESEQVLGRAVWALELAPLADGKPFQSMKIDRTTHVILEIKRYTTDGKTGSLTHFTQFEPVAGLPNTLFLADGGLSPLEVKKDVPIADLTSGNSAFTPVQLYGGFQLQGGDQFEVSGKTVKHMWYTDGLLPVSVFETPLPVKAPEKSPSMIQWSRPLQMGSSTSGNIYQWQKNHQYYTLIGDVQQDLLQEIAGGMKN